MRSRQIILFLAIVLTPLAIAAWLGIKVARDEHRAGQRELQALLESRLRDIDRSIAGIVQAVERELLDRALDRRMDTAALATDAQAMDALRALRREEPMIRQMFAVDAAGRVVFPPSDDTASAGERAFLTRTQAIWRGQAVLYAPPRPEHAPDPAQSARPGAGDGTGDSILGLAQGSEHGFIAWHWEEGLHLLLWRRSDAGGVIGAEIERVALFSRVVAALPQGGDDGRVVIVDSRGEVMHQWGPHEPARGERPVASVPVAFPLDSWRILYFASPARAQALHGTTLRMSFLLGLGAVALALLGMAFLFYRDYARRMRDAAERVGFVTRVSHELKTPLTNIRLYAELMERDIAEDDDRGRDRLAVIIAESQRLTRLIGNVLTFSTQRRGALTLRRTAIAIDDVVASVLSQFAPALAARGITFTHQAGAPEPVHADADAVGQIIANLVSNVEKYAAGGGVLEVVTRQEPGRTTVRVADRGPGIAPAHRDKIFRPFYRVSDRVTDGVTGTGIGLAIARDLARACGGDLGLVATEVGACFELVLPRNPEKSP